MVLIHPSIDPVIISFGIIQIRWYSLAYVLGFIIGIYKSAIRLSKCHPFGKHGFDPLSQKVKK